MFSGLHPAGLFACDFEDNYGCGFLEETDLYGWRMDTQSTDERRGPVYDHTIQAYDGLGEHLIHFEGLLLKV